MALIKCPECGKEFSDKASRCPQCGYPNGGDYIKKPPKGGGYIKILIVIGVAMILFGVINGIRANKNDSKVDSAEAELKPAPGITEFDYSIDSDIVKLERYNGKNELLEIMPSYEIDGSTYNTDLTSFQVSSKNVKNVIIGDGITEVNTSIFNGSDVEKIYFPSTMIIVYDYTLSYLHPDEGTKINIYYAGSEEQWNNIFTEYTSMGEKDSTAEAVGQAAADLLNGLVGVEYDSSLFEYHFSASLDELK